MRSRGTQSPGSQSSLHDSDERMLVHMATMLRALFALFVATSCFAQDAIALFTLNVEMYPDGFNTYDSLAEAYVAQGDRDAAISNYRTSLTLNPNNTNAVLALKALGATP
jgi:tetratricopeptide (TPR) repeat protein